MEKKLQERIADWIRFARDDRVTLVLILLALPTVFQAFIWFNNIMNQEPEMNYAFVYYVDGKEVRMQADSIMKTSKGGIVSTYDGILRIIPGPDEVIKSHPPIME